MKFEHIGIAVSNLEEAIQLYSEILGIKAEDLKPEIGGDRTIKFVMIPVGSHLIELMEPIDPDGWLARFMNRRGEGMHHLGLEVSDIEAVVAGLKAKGIPIATEPTKFSETKVAFLHPRATKNVLIELLEYLK